MNVNKLCLNQERERMVGEGGAGGGPDRQRGRQALCISGGRRGEGGADRQRQAGSLYIYISALQFAILTFIIIIIFSAMVVTRLLNDTR